MRRLLAVFLCGLLAVPSLGADAATNWDGASPKPELEVSLSPGTPPAATGDFFRRLARRMGFVAKPPVVAPPVPLRPALTDEQFVSVVERSGSLAELERNLGMAFDSRSQAIAYIRGRWRAARASRRAAILSAVPRSSGELPTLETSLYGMTFKLHGIVHGDSGWIAPGFSPSPELKKFIQDRVKYYESRGEPCYVEERFNGFFGLGLPRERDLADQTMASWGYLPFWKGFANFFPRAMLSMPMVIPTLAIGFAVIGAWTLSSKKRQGAPPAANASEIQVWHRALRDEPYQHMAFETMSVGKLPEPIDLAMDDFSERNPRGLLARFLSVGKFPWATTAERSLYTAILLIREAYVNKTPVVHYLGGMQHISQIAYFIEHYADQESMDTWQKDYSARRKTLLEIVQP